MSDCFVKNEQTGELILVDEDVYNSRHAYVEARECFEHFAEYQHEPTSIFSAEVYQGLMSIMDCAYKRHRPFENLWYLAVKGLSLN